MTLKQTTRVLMASLAVFLLCGVQAAQGADQAEKVVAGTGSKDIVETASAAGSFKTLLAAVEAAGLTETLKGDGPFTVFAPTDEAFGNLPEGTVEELLKPENRERLVSILTYHVVPGLVLLGKKDLTTVEGDPVLVQPDGVTVNGAKVLALDIQASNGVIHVIDRVLLPPSPRDRAAAAARQVIDLAIERGVPLFNKGQPEACAAIYEVAVASLLEGYAEAVPETQQAELKRALAKARAQDKPSEQAWTLRRALDKAYAELE
jgi:transforming growth factor-beta-induced protein